MFYYHKLRGVHERGKCKYTLAIRSSSRSQLETFGRPGWLAVALRVSELYGTLQEGHRMRAILWLRGFESLKINY